MCRNVIVGVCALLCLAARTAVAQTWTSADVGSVGAAGSATLNGDTWTVNGSGADIWGTSDAFHFVYRSGPMSAGQIVTRVDDLSNTNPFAKAGVMGPESLDPNSAAVILDVKPDGFVELMERPHSGGAMTFKDGRRLMFPVWVRLSWTGVTLWADTSTDGQTWTFLNTAATVLPNFTGLAVTSHDDTQLATAHFSGTASVRTLSPPSWNTVDVGNVGTTGSAAVSNGQWNVRGAGADIWGVDDAFRFLYRQTTIKASQHLFMHVDSITNTNAFAKVGLMVRQSLDADSATVIVDVTPSGNLEVLQRKVTGGEMEYLGGAQVNFPVWIRLALSTTKGGLLVSPLYSYDKQNWSQAGGSVLFTASDPILTGVAVTSHDPSQLATTKFEGLSMLEERRTASEIGAPGLIGDAAIDVTQSEQPLQVDGAGADIWGTSDSFEFVDDGAATALNGFGWFVAIDATNPFAKAGLMYRDGRDADAATVILDVKPDGGIEFMARLCKGCPMMFITGAQIGAGQFAWLTLTRNGSTISAQARTASQSQVFDLGSVEVPMTTPLSGVAVTSHDPSQLARGLFADPTVK